MINKIKARLKSYKEKNFILFCFFKRIRRRPYFLGVDFIICYIYSVFLSYKLFGFFFVPKVFFSSNLFKVVIEKSNGCNISSDSKLAIIFESFHHGVDRTVFTVGKNSQLQICNTIHIGNGCIISLSDNAILTFQGEFNNQSSGITCQTKILCSNNIHIGGACIISWGCYITDTNNHYINGEIVNKAVYIDNDVWISEGCTIAPGAFIGKGSIIGSKSFVKGEFSMNSLIVGCPAKMKKSNVNWKR
ncbi:hypothetical protein CKQ84_15615 [Shewanella sp. WE21]|jgi:acetyltransferase-like isoleucine patch superfamily enzyme|uniref:acyltransferase n=1 Tax=Shewanella sp. WE21 TaxID=2029986 RepID=UPI000CF62424|nr:hypothetical protein [Shewanella sp. WE21]AVI67195.1 hypothetical protein CKQ84_15615 [Shewanella sp. WE21]